ncbi:MAG TPA: hypothetical protein VGL91_16225 [Acidobacteriota bacterium]|jgi:hypothetical protein
MRHLTVILYTFVAASGIASAQSQELILPIVVNGYVKQPIHFQTIFRIVNLSATATEVALEAFQNDGTPVRLLELFPIPRPGTKTVLKVDPLGSAEAFTAEDVPSFNGWARVTFDPSANIQISSEVALINGIVGPHPICQRPSTEIITSAQVPPVKAAFKFSAFAVNRPNRQSGYAFVNPSPTDTVDVFLSLLDSTGKLVASGNLKILPQARISKLLSELVSSPPSDFMGTLRVTIANGPLIGVGALNILFPEGKFLELPVTPVNVVCTAVQQAARNPLTGECRLFGSPCVIPEGWLLVDSCAGKK